MITLNQCSHCACSSTPESEDYTGGLSEEDQVQRAMYESMRDSEYKPLSLIKSNHFYGTKPLYQWIQRGRSIKQKVTRENY